MSMNTYPYDEKCALVITGALATAILIQDSVENDPGSLPEEIKAALKTMAPYQVAEDPRFQDLLKELDFCDIQYAYDALENADVSGLSHCTEFQGKATIPEEFQSDGKAEIDFEDDFFVCVTTSREAKLFSAAYEKPWELVNEYRDALEHLAGPRVPYEKFIYDVSGTYVC